MPDTSQCSIRSFFVPLPAPVRRQSVAFGLKRLIRVPVTSGTLHVGGMTALITFNTINRNGIAFKYSLFYLNKSFKWIRINASPWSI